MLLEHLARAGPSTFGAITKELGFPGSSTHQLLQTMVGRGFIEFDPLTRTFRLGLRLWEVAQAYSGSEDLVALAQPLMDELVGETTETVQLARLDGLDNVYLAISESPHPMKLVSSVGARLPAHTTGVGKALLAQVAPDTLDTLLHGVQLRAFTPRTITDHEALRRELKRIRANGYAEDREEYLVGCRCVAMPIRNRSGVTLAAMSVSIPTPRFNRTVAANARDALAKTVKKLERRLGA